MMAWYWWPVVVFLSGCGIFATAALVAHYTDKHKQTEAYKDKGGGND